MVDHEYFSDDKVSRGKKNQTSYFDLMTNCYQYTYTLSTLPKHDLFLHHTERIDYCRESYNIMQVTQGSFMLQVCTPKKKLSRSNANKKENRKIDIN